MSGLRHDVNSMDEGCFSVHFRVEDAKELSPLLRIPGLVPGVRIPGWRNHIVLSLFGQVASRLGAFPRAFPGHCDVMSGWSSCWFRH